MEIFNRIDSAVRDEVYRGLDSDKHMVSLKPSEYGFVHRELKYKNTFHYIDLNDNAVFLIRITSARGIETVMKGKKVVSVARGLRGPSIELNVDGFGERYRFDFDLDNHINLYELKRILASREVFMHFILLGEEQYLHCFSAMLSIDNRIMERLVYMLELTSQGEYPRIDFKGFSDKECSYIKFNGDLKLLEDMLEALDKLQKWGSKEEFNVYVDYDQGFMFFFEGDTKNKEYIKKVLIQKYELQEEGMGKARGKPFFKYEKGMIYFYKDNIKFQDEVVLKLE